MQISNPLTTNYSLHKTSPNIQAAKLAFKGNAELQTSIKLPPREQAYKDPYKYFADFMTKANTGPEVQPSQAERDTLDTLLFENGQDPYATLEPKVGANEWRERGLPSSGQDILQKKNSDQELGNGAYYIISGNKKMVSRIVPIGTESSLEICLERDPSGHIIRKITVEGDLFMDFWKQRGGYMPPDKHPDSFKIELIQDLSERANDPILNIKPGLPRDKQIDTSKAEDLANWMIKIAQRPQVFQQDGIPKDIKRIWLDAYPVSLPLLGATCYVPIRRP